MKKFLDLGSLTAIAVALILIGYLYLPQRPAQAAESVGAFRDFPVGVTHVINLGVRREALEDLRPRERLDQMRDWLLFTSVAASGLSAAEMNKALFDLPPIRHGYVQPVANFEYGETRSCYLGKGQVIALVPAETSDERTERLARIADEQRKNLGVKPAKLLVFEYDLRLAADPARQTATLTRRAPVEVKDLYAASAGYYEAKINSLDDLKRFMAQVDDLTYASLSDGLTVGGRKIKGHSYRGIRVEEIAALYQSEAKLRAARDAIQRKIDDYNARCAQFVYHTEAEREEIKSRCENERAALKEEQRQARAAGALRDGSGFSLDPTYDYAALAQKFDASFASEIRRSLSGKSLDAADGDLPAPASGGLAAATVEQEIARAREGLAGKDADPLFELLYEVKTKGEDGEAVANRIEKTVEGEYGYQKARYDGELQGTEAGMVLFYTDLLAKLWALNYQGSSPVGDVPGFRPMTALPVSSVYIQELRELRETRLWFGKQERGFQVADDGRSVLFARTATRVYAASSNPFRPGVEVKPNARSAAFLDWWDEHYDEIARYEPEYERLNEIMKWSLVVTWLNQQEQGSKLGFLQSVPVEHGNWFPDWVKQRPLRYTAWDRVGFNQRGSDATATETLPRLASDDYLLFGEVRRLTGGVSLASETDFANRVALSAETKVAPVALRSNLALGESTGSSLKTFEGTSYSFGGSSPENAVTTATAEGGAKLRGLHGELSNRPIERVIEQGGGRFEIGMSVGGVPSGKLTVPNAENGFSLGWASRDIDTGMTLARRLSTSPDAAKLLALDPHVDAAIALRGDGGYFVKLEGSERWLKVTPEDALHASPRSDYAAHVGGFDIGAKNYDLVWTKPEEVSDILREGETLTLRKVPHTDNRYEMEIGTPDPAGVPISIEYDGMIVRGTRNAEAGEVSFAYNDLPQTLRDDPTLLRRLVAEAKPAEGSRYIAGEFSKGGVIEQVRGGDYRMAARAMTEAPAQSKAQLDAYLSIRLAECQGMMLNGHYEMAGQQLDELIQIYGPREELQLHKLVTELSVERDSLTRLVTQGNPATVRDELSARLSDDLAPGRGGDAVKVGRDHNDLLIQYEVSDLSGSEPLTVGDLKRTKTYIYVQDTPGLNNLDWSVSPQRTLSAVLSGQIEGRGIKLPRGIGVARFKPTVIYDRADGITFRAAGTDGGEGGGFLRPRPFRGGGGEGSRDYIPFLLPCLDDDNNRNGSTKDDKDCDDNDDDNSIVIIVRK